MCGTPHGWVKHSQSPRQGCQLRLCGQERQTVPQNRFPFWPRWIAAPPGQTGPRVVNLPPSGQLFSSSDSARKDLVSYSPRGHEESDVTERLNSKRIVLYQGHSVGLCGWQDEHSEGAVARLVLVSGNLCFWTYVELLSFSFAPGSPSLLISSTACSN